MTFDEFWKQSGWHSENAELYEGTSEYNLAKDAYEAGRAEVAAALDALRADLYSSLSETAMDYSLGIRQSIMQLDIVIEALGLPAAKGEE